MSQPCRDFTLERPPLVAVLAKVQFDPVLKMGSYVADLQDVLRNEGFPAFEQRVIKQFKIVRAGAPESREQAIWLFSNNERTRVLALAVDSLSFLASDYTTFEDFSQMLRKGLEVISSVVKPASAVMLGFRTVNVIEPLDETDPTSVMSQLYEGLKGIQQEYLDTNHFHHFYRYWSNTTHGNLVIHGRYAHGDTCLPEDLREGALNLPKRFSEKPYVYVLDLDHSTGRRKQVFAFQTEELISKLDCLHETVNAGFLACVTQEALANWGYRPRESAESSSSR